MRIGYFDCSSGASGDMLLGALLDALLQESGETLSSTAELELSSEPAVGIPESLSRWHEQVRGLLALEPDGRVLLKRVQRAGMSSLKVDFYAGEVHADEHQHHSHRHLRHIIEIFTAQREAGSFDPLAFESVSNTFKLLAEAEAKVHGSTIESVHFHEVGAFDSIMDVAGVAVAMNLLNLSTVSCSAVSLGSGTVQTAHGTLAVPAPAVVEVMKLTAMPSSGLELEGECLTPTGAALLATFVKDWGGVPQFNRIIAQGVGAGTRDPQEKPNTVRFFLGEIYCSRFKMRYRLQP